MKVLINTTNGKGEATITERVKKDSKGFNQTIATITVGNPREPKSNSIILEFDSNELQRAINALWGEQITEF